MFLSFFYVSNVYAEKKDVYVNSSDTIMNYDLYEELCKIYSKSYIEFITQEKYELLIKNGINNIKIIDVSDNQAISTFSTVYTTTYKRLRLIKNGELITLQLNWLILPKTRSYDVMGIRLDRVKLSGNPYFSQTYLLDGNYQISNNHYLQNYSNGFGTSFLLPSGDITNLTQTIDFFYNGSGVVFGSYQHAQQKVSMANSKKYTISHTGYGNVILFNGNIGNNYDAMNGVYITI